MRVSPDGDDGLGTEHLQKREEQVSKHFALRPRVTAVGERVARFEWMQRQDVPQENWLVNLGQNFPDDGCRTLGDRRTFRCARQRQTTVYLAEGLKVYFIGEW